MIYIVEGINKSGKTTFCEQFSKFCNIPILPLRRPVMDKEGYIVPYVIGTISSYISLPSFILDRHWPSQYVYHIDTELKDFEELDKLFSSISKIIYLYCSASTLAKRFKQLNFSPSLSNEVLLSRYERFLAFTRIPVVYVNTSEEVNYENII